MKTRTKVLAAVVVVIVVILAIAVAAGGDDHDYRSQAEQEIDKYGYDSTVTEYEVEKGINGFGVSIIKVSGTFVSDGEEHSFVMTTFSDHELATLEIDGRSFWGDDMGDASYNYTAEEIGPFGYESFGYTYTEEPDEGMTFVLVTLTVKNVGHTDGLTVTAPDFENSLGNIYSMDYSATSHHDSSYSDLSFTSIGLGNTVTFSLVYQVPEGTADGEVRWSDLDLDVYGYVLDLELGRA